MKVGLYTCFRAALAAAFIGGVGGVFVHDCTSTPSRTEARREACSYKCLSQTHRWPDRVEWLGRDEAGRIRCECYKKEVMR